MTDDILMKELFLYIFASRNVDLEEEMEELHLSRKDNPYLSSCEALDDPDFGDEPGSPLPRYRLQWTVDSGEFK